MLPPISSSLRVLFRQNNARCRRRRCSPFIGVGDRVLTTRSCRLIGMDVSYIFSCALLVTSVSSSTFTPPDILWLNENEVCKRSVHSGKTHVCKVLSDCKTAIDDIRDNVKFPTICIIKSKMPVVCCAPESVSRNERLGKEEEKPTDSPDITLHFESYKDGLVQDNLITYSRPRRRLSWRSLNQTKYKQKPKQTISIISL